MKLLLTIFCLLILVSCSKPEVPSHRLIENGGLFYEVDSNYPFSGISVHNVNTKLFSKTYIEKGITLRKETFYPQGTIHTIETFTEGVGGNKVQVFDEEGKDISNVVYLTLWDDGSIKSRGNYSNGKKEGVWEEFNRSGNSIKRTHWENNLLIPITDFENIVLRTDIPYTVNSNEPYTGIIRFREEGEYDEVTLQQFKDGKPEGITEEYYESGKLKEYCSFNKGLTYSFTGFYILDYVFGEHEVGDGCYYFYENGQKQYENYIVEENGIELYKWIEYYINGQISEQSGHTLLNEKEFVEQGKTIHFYENGQVKSEVVYDKGVVVSGKRFNETGMDISNGEGMGEDGSKKGFFSNGFKEGRWEDENGGFDTYKENKKEGPSVYMYWKGCTHEIGSYKNNKKEGKWIEYGSCKEDDDPFEVLYYENGKLVER